jgi:hypothetical protein
VQRDDPHQLTAASEAALKDVAGLANALFYGSPEDRKDPRIALKGQCQRVETTMVREADVFFHQARASAGLSSSRPPPPRPSCLSPGAPQSAPKPRRWPAIQAVLSV